LCAVHPARPLGTKSSRDLSQGREAVRRSFGQFEPDAELYDDGNPRSLKEFTRNALGHERFTSIDCVENNGPDLTGAFHSERWGDFQTCFRFQLSPAGKINRLDIGQAT
jgi:hypothetical protein